MLEIGGGDGRSTEALLCHCQSAIAERTPSSAAAHGLHMTSGRACWRVEGCRPGERDAGHNNARQRPRRNSIAVNGVLVMRQGRA